MIKFQVSNTQHLQPHLEASIYNMFYLNFKNIN